MRMYRPGLPPVITDEPDEAPPQAPAPKPVVFLSVEEAMAHAKARALATGYNPQQPEIIPNPTPSPPVTLTGEAPANQSAEVQFTNVGQQMPMGVLGIAGSAQAFAVAQNPPQIAVDPVEILPSKQADSAAPPPPVEGIPQAPEPTAPDVTGMKFPDDVFASELMK